VSRKIIIEKHPDSNRKIYHVNFEISNTVIEDFKRPLRESSKPYLDKLGPTGKRIIKKLFEIEGISEVFIKPYEITVSKGNAFSWVKIDPLIIKVLSNQRIPKHLWDETLWEHFVRVVSGKWQSFVGKIK